MIPRRELFALGGGIEEPLYVVSVIEDREQKLSDEGDKSRCWRTRSLATSYLAQPPFSRLENGPFSLKVLKFLVVCLLQTLLFSFLYICISGISFETVS